MSQNVGAAHPPGPNSFSVGFGPAPRSAAPLEASERGLQPRLGPGLDLHLDLGPRPAGRELVEAAESQPVAPPRQSQREGPARRERPDRRQGAAPPVEDLESEELARPVGGESTAQGAGRERFDAELVLAGLQEEGLAHEGRRPDALDAELVPARVAEREEGAAPASETTVREEPRALGRLAVALVRRPRCRPRRRRRSEEHTSELQSQSNLV